MQRIKKGNIFKEKQKDKSIRWSKVKKFAAPEQSVVVWLFSRFVAVTVPLRNETISLLEALCPFGNDGDPLPHSLTQTFPPLVCYHTDHPYREGGRGKAVGVAHGQTGEDPDVAGPQQAHLSREPEQVLRLLVWTVRQQDLGVQLQTEEWSSWNTAVLLYLL